MGMGVAGLAVLGLGSLFLIIKQIFAPEANVDSSRNGKSHQYWLVFFGSRIYCFILQELWWYLYQKQQM